jgi:endonuclease/exonuclease/phosphatase (EEP) superfamily protein YafD
VDVAACLAILGFLAGFLGKLWWVFDIASHFRVQYAVTLFVAAGLFALVKRKKSALLCLAPALVISALLATSFSPRPLKPTEGAHFKIVSFNVNTANSNYREVLDYLFAQDADFIFLMEVDPIWMASLRELEKKYPYRIESARWDNFGITAFSKQPVSGPGASEDGDIGIPILDVTTQIFGTNFRLLGIHTIPPVGSEQSRLRNHQLLATADAIDLRKTPALLFGDFNITPFSPWYREVLNRSGLRNAADGYGCFPTWSPDNPIFSLPIDHVLIPPQLIVSKFEIGPTCGSDHHALAVTLEMRTVLR